ncbi:hypothetical protein BLNAU_14755 [Blattamonas nauphoetae]|uniref:Uncharacterized protein n=1 Tax=Blattamonas nauphoetae TaxID=2049346 RepID=A0ABQ9XF83_9EUKA|nr:hypothetical protein BLNAU_14755 [Blattamonas nauphoetae]
MCSVAFEMLIGLDTPSIRLGSKGLPSTEVHREDCALRCGIQATPSTQRRYRIEERLRARLLLRATSNAMRNDAPQEGHRKNIPWAAMSEEERRVADEERRARYADDMARRKEERDLNEKKVLERARSRTISTKRTSLQRRRIVHDVKRSETEDSSCCCDEIQEKAGWKRDRDLFNLGELMDLAGDSPHLSIDNSG